MKNKTSWLVGGLITLTVLGTAFSLSSTGSAAEKSEAANMPKMMQDSQMSSDMMQSKDMQKMCTDMMQSKDMQKMCSDMMANPEMQKTMKQMMSGMSKNADETSVQ